MPLTLKLKKLNAKKKCFFLNKRYIYFLFSNFCHRILYRSGDVDIAAFRAIASEHDNDFVYGQNGFFI